MGVVDQARQGTETLDGRADRKVGGLLQPHVTLDESDVGTEFGPKFCFGLCVDVDRDDLGATPDEDTQDRPIDTGARRGDHDPVLKLHDHVLPARRRAHRLPLSAARSVRLRA